jgi:peroxiredoxin
MTLEIGQPAPHFTLHDSDKNVVSLNDHLGKNILLLFFPLAFTGVCTKELCAIRDDISNYNNANAIVFGISVDSFATLKKFKEEQGYNFTLLSDFNKEVSTLYDCIYNDFAGWMKGVSKRSAFLIDKQGILRYAEVLGNPGEVPNFEAIQKLLASLS